MMGQKWIIKSPHKNSSMRELHFNFQTRSARDLQSQHEQAQNSDSSTSCTNHIITVKNEGTPKDNNLNKSR